MPKLILISIKELAFASIYCFVDRIKSAITLTRKPEEKICVSVGKGCRFMTRMDACLHIFKKCSLDKLEALTAIRKKREAAEGHG